MPEKQNNRYPLIAAIAALVAAVALAVVIYLGWAAELWRAAVALLRAVGDSFLAAFRAAGERMAETAGAGVVSIGLWIAVVVAVAFWRRALLWRRWRLVVGSAALVVGIQGGLSFFEGELPLIGDAPLGGEWGDQHSGKQHDTRLPAGGSDRRTWHRDHIAGTHMARPPRCRPGNAARRCRIRAGIQSGASPQAVGTRDRGRRSRRSRACPRHARQAERRQG